MHPRILKNAKCFVLQQNVGARVPTRYTLGKSFPDLNSVITVIANLMSFWNMKDFKAIGAFRKDHENFQDNVLII